MYNAAEIKTVGELQQLFNQAAFGEPVMLSNPDLVVLSREEYKNLHNAAYDSKIRAAIKRVKNGEGLVYKSMEELEAMEQ